MGHADHLPLTLQESYTYDAVGNLLSKTDRKNQTIQYVYDALYRLTSKAYPDSTSVEYAYDLAGKVGAEPALPGMNRRPIGCPSFRGFRKLGTTAADIKRLFSLASPPSAALSPRPVQPRHRRNADSYSTATVPVPVRAHAPSAHFTTRAAADSPPGAEAPVPSVQNPRPHRH